MGLMLKVKDLCFSYRERPVLKDVDLEVRKGEVVGILGPNGCGKTTLLKLLNRNLRPESGQVWMEDKDLEAVSKKEIARHIAVVPQGNEIRFAFTVRDIVMMGRMPFLQQFQGESSEDSAHRGGGDAEDEHLRVRRPLHQHHERWGEADGSSSPAPSPRGRRSSCWTSRPCIWTSTTSSRSWTW